ncbi:MAG: GspH/FimT family pseudopilin [Pseudomonadota bacterium]
MIGNRGFTRIEMLAVAAIVSIVTSAAVPEYLSWLPRWRLKSAAIDLFSNLQLAKVTAIRRGISCRVLYRPGGYCISLASSGAVLKTVTLEDYGSGVAFRGPPPTCRTYSRSQITFNSRGLSNAGYAYLSAADAGVHYRVGPTTAGVIKLQKLVGKKWR